MKTPIDDDLFQTAQRIATDCGYTHNPLALRFAEALQAERDRGAHEAPPPEGWRGLLRDRLEAIARAEKAEKWAADWRGVSEAASKAEEALQKRVAELEADKLLVCQTADRALKERDTWRAAQESAQQRLIDMIMRCGALQDEIKAANHRCDEARRVARVLVLPIERTDECELITPEERDAFLAACAYPEQPEAKL